MVSPSSKRRAAKVGIEGSAALLLFARQPQRFLLTFEVKCMHFHGTEVRKPIPSCQIYKGTVFELVDQAVDFVMSKIDRAVGTRALGSQAPVTYELPREAVAEAIVNAVTHRDYTSNASVQVMLFPDRLEFWNPGELPQALSIPQLSRPHVSIPRNPLIPRRCPESPRQPAIHSASFAHHPSDREAAHSPPTLRADGQPRRSDSALRRQEHRSDRGPTPAARCRGYSATAGEIRYTVPRGGEVALEQSDSVTLRPPKFSCHQMIELHC